MDEGAQLLGGLQDGRFPVEGGLPAHVPALGELAAHADADGDGGAVPLRGGDQGLGGAGRQDVVAVEEHDVRGGGGRDAVVARGAAAAAVLRAAHHPHPGVQGGQFVEHPRRAVAGAVVDRHDLGHHGTLVERGPDGLADQLLVVVGDDDDAEQARGLGRGNGTHGQDPTGAPGPLPRPVEGLPGPAPTGRDLPERDRGRLGTRPGTGPAGGGPEPLERDC